MEARIRPRTALISEIQRFCVHDGPGIRTTVFFKGCALRCSWCHNPESVAKHREVLYDADRCLHCGACAAACGEGAHVAGPGGHRFLRESCRLCMKCVEACPSGALEVAGREMDLEEVLAEGEADRVFYEESGGGMTLSGGEPLMQIGFARELCREARARGIHVCVETGGFGPLEELLGLVPHVDLFLWDVKDTDPRRHLRHTGVPPGVILRNLEEVDRRGARTVLRCPIVRGVNAEPGHVESVARLSRRLANCEGVELLPYHPLGEGKLERLGRRGAGRQEWTPGPDLMRELNGVLRGRLPVARLLTQSRHQ